MEHGARNSLLVAPMPTASTSQVLGNNESFEPFTANVYTRRVLAGEFVCVNKHLVEDLIKINLWVPHIKNQLVAHNGSVQDIAEIPADLKMLYKTVWEIPQKQLINLAVARGPYICQSQSLNLYMPNPEHKKMTAMHFYGWEKGLKTGQYYLRSRPARDAIKFTVNMEALLSAAESNSKDAILTALDKVKEHKSVNLVGKKTVMPQGGFSDDVKQGSEKA
jgi:ribonucleotide reductase alpha subunit